MTMIAPYGSWESPITAADVARGQVPLSFPAVAGDEAWWHEGRPDEGGRTAIMASRGGGAKPRELLPAPYNARTRVHEYGGRAYLPVPLPGGGFDLVFANFADQRLYRAPTSSVSTGSAFEATPLTPEPEVPTGLRYADMTLSPDGREVRCVREAHSAGHDGQEPAITRAIVAVPLDGTAHNDPSAIRVLVTGADFFAFPTPSPDGTRLAWINWDHPRMPWDGTELRVGPVTGVTVADSAPVMGGPAESVLAPLWRDDDSLYAISDASGWWNLYLVSLPGGAAPSPLYPAEEEFAGPLWQLGGRPFAMLGDGRLAVVHGRGCLRLGLLDPETSELTDLDLPIPEFGAALSADAAAIVGLAGGPAQPHSVVRVDAPTSRMEVLRRELDELPDEAYLPVPRHVELEGRYGRVVHALVYPPSSPDATGPEGELPPYVVWVHGGPTGHAVGLLDLEKAYFTSRGIGIVDVNYGGSTGYGRLYRERLRLGWGLVDVEDVTAAAQALAEAGEADGERLAIRGASAGGWTALAAVTANPGAVFSAATSYYGVGDLREFASQTHDFESHYLDGLLGPLPGFAALYAERSPTGHVTDKTCPILLLQGLDDPVVPPTQSEGIAEQLAAHGIRHALLEFEGESHGFRRTETIIKCLEAELSCYAQILGFTPENIPTLTLATDHQPPQTPRSPTPSGRPAEADGKPDAEVPADSKR